MNKIKVIFNFIRVRQYYKNIIIFLPLIFSLQLFSIQDFIISIIGFVSLCLISSSIYVKNDIYDITEDKIHPEKQNRPLPSRLISVGQAWVTFLILLSSGLLLSFYLDWSFGIVLILILINSEIYSRWIKKLVFLDAFSIGGNFILRAIAGIVLLETSVSPWILLGVFFVALFLAFLKRKREYEMLKGKSGEHRKSLKEYTSFSLDSSIVISALMIIATYSLYSINGPNNDWRLIITVPIVLFVILRQLHLSSLNNILSHTREIYQDKQIATAFIFYGILIIYLMYLAPNYLFM